MSGETGFVAGDSIGDCGEAEVRVAAEAGGEGGEAAVDEGGVEEGDVDGGGGEREEVGEFEEAVEGAL